MVVSDCCNSNSQQTDVGKCVQVGNGRTVFYPHSFLTGIFEAGIISFAFCAKRIVTFKVFAVSVNRKS